ncbi:MAG: hypothetical protein WCC06_06115 [Candidatus Aminicenantales bacterium]
MKKKRILTVLALLFLVYAAWLGWGVLHFKKYTSAPLPSFSSEPSVPTEEFSSPPTSFEIEAVYHIHSRYSDGRSSVEKIAKLASRSSLDCLILTDHGNPNSKSIASAGWKYGVLVCAGSELSVSRGHLVGLGFSLPRIPFSQNTEIAVREIGALGGFTIIAHPYSKTRWSWGGFIEYSGIELINADSDLKTNFLASLIYLPALLIRPEYALLKMLDEPSQSVRKWDELARRHPLYGYFSADAHFLYRSLFSLFRLHILLPAPLAQEFEAARRQVLDALRCGNFYNSIEAAAEAAGFQFWAEKARHASRMGSSLSIDSSSPAVLQMVTPFSFAKETRLIHNGNIIFSTDKERSRFAVRAPGVYRVEVYLKENSPLGKNIPWIVSNPIFIGKEKE